ncbi:MAG TPA: M15 family metallopeptidase [Longimicrobiaceae bacterium]|nr:M15 family metallopeptidase [Longimicrobiaceae bacterium]
MPNTIATSTFTPAPTLDEVRTGARVLEKGQSGEAVAHVQRLLGVGADGKFGDKTAGAVADFQRRKGMQIDPGFLGKVGRFTLTALEQEVALPPIVVAPDGAGNFDPAGHLEKVHPELKKRMLAVVAALAARGMQMRITDGRRTFAEQDALFRKGRHVVDGRLVCIKKGCAGTVTNARGGMSNHNYGLAIDGYPVLEGKVRFSEPASPAALRKRFFEVQAAIGTEGERVGLVWGGRWTSPFDPPHLQLFGQKELKPSECLQIFRAAGDSLQAVWDEATRRIHERQL